MGAEARVSGPRPAAHFSDAAAGFPARVVATPASILCYCTLRRHLRGSDATEFPLRGPDGWIASLLAAPSIGNPVPRCNGGRRRQTLGMKPFDLHVTTLLHPRKGSGSHKCRDGVASRVRVKRSILLSLGNRNSL